MNASFNISTYFPFWFTPIICNPKTNRYSNISKIPTKCYAFEGNLLNKELPTLIRILQRIVEAVGVAVEVLRTRRVLDERVGHQEAAEGVVVQTRVAVDQVV